MYKLVIADDEKIIRMGLKEILDWEELGFEIQEVFADGEEVLAYLEYVVPDVILTDIKMANVSGIEIARYVSEHKMPCKVILLSGFHEFELAVEAIKHNAENYLLKPVNPDELHATFADLRKKLDEEKVVRQVTNQEQENMQEMRSILEVQFLEELVFGAVTSQEYVDSRFQLIYPKLQIENTGCIVFDIIIENFDYFIQNTWEYSYDQFEESLKNFLGVNGNDYLFRIIYKRKNTLRVLAIQCDRSGDWFGAKKAEEDVSAILKDIENLFSVKTKYAIQGIYRNMYEMCSSRKHIGELSPQQETLNGIQMEEQIHLMVSNMLTGNSLKAQQLYHSILDRMTEYTAIRRNREIDRIFAVLCKALSGSNERLAQMLQAYIKEDDILALPGETAAREYCNRVFDYIRMAENREERSADNLVGRAKKYIGDNIYRDISREEVARKLYICPSYLSKLFVKETGETYLTYVNRVKMNKAIELLKNPAKKSYQIGEMLGYSTSKYFVRLFKAQTGMTPSEYRRKVLSMNGNENEE